jgi:hypothetical protein
MATNWGMPVISTVLARHDPMASPISMATAISPAVTAHGRALSRRASAMVATSAIAIPVMPNRLPRSAVSCFDSPASAKTNSTPATM